MANWQNVGLHFILVFILCSVLFCLCASWVAADFSKQPVTGSSLYFHWQSPGKACSSFPGVTSLVITTIKPAQSLPHSSVYVCQPLISLVSFLRFIVFYFGKCINMTTATINSTNAYLTRTWDMKIHTIRTRSLSRKLSFFSSSKKKSAAPFQQASSEETKSKPSKKSVRKWADGFTFLLNDKHGLSLFQTFLCSEYSEENVQFWRACEEYKRSASLSSSTSEERDKLAASIASDYLAVQAPREVNLDSKTRVATMAAVKKGSANAATFDAAQSRIESLMEKDSYPRFLRSQCYLKTLKTADKR